MCCELFKSQISKLRGGAASTTRTKLVDRLLSPHHTVEQSIMSGLEQHVSYRERREGCRSMLSDHLAVGLICDSYIYIQLYLDLCRFIF